MPWFSKKNKQIEAVPPEERVVKTENVFVKCDECEAHLYKRELEESLQVCSQCGNHFRIGARERLAMLFDDGKYEELDAEVISIDPLEFVDTKPYPERLKQAGKIPAFLKQSSTVAARLETIWSLPARWTWHSSAARWVRRSVKRSRD